MKNKKILRIVAVCIPVLLIGAFFWPWISSFLAMRVPGLGKVDYVPHRAWCDLTFNGTVREVAETEVAIENVSIRTGDKWLDDIEEYLGCPLSEAVFVTDRPYFSYEYEGEYTSQIYPTFVLEESWPIVFHDGYYEDEEPDWDCLIEVGDGVFHLSDDWGLEVYDSDIRPILFERMHAAYE